MKEIIKEIVSKNKRYKVQVIKRNNGFFTTEVFAWFLDYEYEYWAPIKQGISLIDTEKHAIAIAMEDLKVYSGEND
ncbi:MULTISPECIES: hypothetical protein [Bacillus]|uniref:Phage protein n=1 Tax=Bacillus wiedmannii TaxID=1890302 RepID=A0AB73RZE3_9BACI|nr:MULTISPECIES: hypothetical protein [Bacillus cereus group]EOP07254.1 hypothetical protein ICS_04577 [Bacillus cereus BAG2O-3]EOQ14432.1 hypothetical protein KQ3_00315 [Bacillus cereus B5-2]MDA1603014.1 hypothetical protein [Bacillus cereus]PFW81121.1 hypothetical protein COL27_19415 [Bacillus sp. AFS075960]RFB48395.1 hypothetical protein DZB83_08035 [Bacillus sp. dmp10]RFB76110.1 hypothetical protein DZB94_08395 [Bacillus sp. AW]